MEARLVRNCTLTKVNCSHFCHFVNLASVTAYIVFRLSSKQFVKLLNLAFAGLTGDEITLPRILEAERIAGNLAPLVHPSVKAIYEAIRELGGGDLKIDGVNHLLEYPEYSDAGQLKEMLSLLENKENLLRLVSSGEEGKDLQVHIGSENEIGAMNNSAFIYRTVRLGGKVVGAVGVIGPCRMDYSRVIAILNHLSEGIADVMDEEDGKQRY